MENNTSLGGVIASLGDALMSVVQPVHDALDPDGENEENKLAYYVGGTTLILVALFFAFRKKLSPTKIKYRVRKARNYVRSYRRKK